MDDVRMLPMPVPVPVPVDRCLPVESSRPPPPPRIGLLLLPLLMPSWPWLPGRRRAGDVLAEAAAADAGKGFGGAGSAHFFRSTGVSRRCCVGALLAAATAAAAAATAAEAPAVFAAAAAAAAA
eukprot:CAMPEP_0197595000 /NCGR_PEP_ID=MMETSP1326-20131121/21844_1 /TAXON_ID=1155430 /ORGANISM="Genus nov. species nov., Strain RCC2288" /LENGTH=123 /DNA_ID=CAMNT_0043161279 /DNA_START=30 /DNA_END=399 /DNA_ORIENTATION=+